MQQSDFNRVLMRPDVRECSAVLHCAWVDDSSSGIMLAVIPSLHGLGYYLI